MFAEHGNLVDTDTSGRKKPAQNTLNHV